MLEKRINYVNCFRGAIPKYANSGYRSKVRENMLGNKRVTLESLTRNTSLFYSKSKIITQASLVKNLPAMQETLVQLLG